MQLSVAVEAAARCLRSGELHHYTHSHTGQCRAGAADASQSKLLTGIIQTLSWITLEISMSCILDRLRDW